MDTITWAKVIFVTAICVYTKVQGTVHIECTKTDRNTASIPLNCSSNQMIHVISELYGRRTSEDNCRVVRNDSTKLFERDSSGLVVNCNGHVSCIEQTSCGAHCNGGGHAFEITYTCVEESKDICSPLHEKDLFPSLYLHSPGFLNKIEVEEERCECSVTGADLEVTLIEKGIKDVLQLNTSGTSNTPWKHRPVDTFNMQIASKAENILISFTAGQQARLWIKIAGSIADVTCNMKSTQTTLTSRKLTTITTKKSTTITQTTTTHQTSSSTATEKSSTQRESTSMTQSGEYRTTTKNPSALTISETALSTTKSYETTTEAHKTNIESLTVMTVSVGSLVINFLLFAIIVVFFNCIKQRLQKNGRAQTVGTSDDYARGSNEPINTYCDLAEYQNADEGYRKVHVYADSKF